MDQLYKRVLTGYTEVLSCGSTISQSRNICIINLIRWLHKVLSNIYFFDEVTFSGPLVLKGSYYLYTDFLRKKYTFSVDTISKQLFFDV